jgi:hypothetical protein
MTCSLRKTVGGKKKRAIKKTRNLRKKGGCGCNNALGSLQQGGADFFTHSNVEPPSFIGEPADKYYSLNNYNNDTQYMQESSRLASQPKTTALLMGGRRKKGKSRKNVKKRIRGGNSFRISDQALQITSDPLLYGKSDPISMMGTVSGSLSGMNIVNGHSGYASQPYPIAYPK